MALQDYSFIQFLNYHHLLAYPCWTQALLFMNAREFLLSTPNSGWAYWLHQLLAVFPQRPPYSQQQRRHSTDNMGDFNWNDTTSNHHPQPCICNGVGPLLQVKAVLRMRERQNLAHQLFSGILSHKHKTWYLWQIYCTIVGPRPWSNDWHSSTSLCIGYWYSYRLSNYRHWIWSAHCAGNFWQWAHKQSLHAS